MEENNEMHIPAVTCAVCKHLRRRCDETCILAPYFPPEKTEDFQIIHRIFGIPSLTKVITSVEENERDKTVETLVLEAKMRLQDPVHGFVAVERSLGAEIEKVTKELDEVKQQLQVFLTRNDKNI